MEKLRKVSQKRVTTVNDFVLKTFKTTSDLHSSLKRQRITPKNEYLEIGKKSLELLRSTDLKKSIKMTNEKEEAFRMAAEVKSLEYYRRAEPNEKIASMIREQKDRRREKHFMLLTDYEKLVNSYYKEIEMEYSMIKEDVVEFFKVNDREIRAYFRELTDKALLAHKKSFLTDLKRYISNNQDYRAEKIMSLLAKLNDVEEQRERSMGSILIDLRESLTENAYYLEPQVFELIREEEAKYEEVIRKTKIENENYVDEANASQRKTFEEYEAMAVEYDKKWRKLHHEAALTAFQQEMQKEEYTNPPERNAIYAELKDEQIEVYKDRKEILGEIANLDPRTIRKTNIDKLVELAKELYDRAQQKYDVRFEEILAQYNSLEGKLMFIKEELKEKLVDYDAELEEGQTVEGILEGEVQQRISEILTNDKKVMSDAISCIEDNDLKANELIVNLLNFYVKIGTMQDTTETNIEKSRFEYEMSKAKIADHNDERLEVLNDELAEKRKNVREAVHHIKLEDFLKEGFSKLDEIEAEYRCVHDKNLELVQAHPLEIRDFFNAYEKDLAAKFELVDETKQAEIQAKYQKEAEEKVKKLLEEEEQRLREEEEQAAAQGEKNGKKAAKPPAKKDPKKQQKEMEERQAQLLAEVGVRSVEVYESPFGTKWLHMLTLEEFVREFFCIKEEEGGKNVTNRSRNSRTSVHANAVSKNTSGVVQQEQLKEAIQANKPADSKAKKDDKKKEEQQPQQEAVPVKQETKATYFVEWKVTAPRDLNDKLLLSEEVFFAFNEIHGLIHNLLVGFFGNVDKRRQEILTTNETEDKEFVENSMVLLDQRLKAHYPLKGFLETEVYQTRSAEIAEHKKRYERHIRVIIEKLDNQTEEFNLYLEESVENLKTFEQDHKEIREALTIAETLSRMDGLQRQARDKTAKFSENCMEIENHLKILSIDETNKLLNFNRDFIKNLMLFKNGGNFSEEEVEWYDGMLKDIDEKIRQEMEAREKKLSEIQELLTKRKQQLNAQFETDYAIALEDLSAKTGTGKKYGKPRRMAQEKLRAEMNKCEKAQEAVSKVLDNLEKQYEEYKEAVENGDNQFFTGEVSFSLLVRKNMMAFRSCVARYSAHIEAIVKECPVEAMPRITFIEERLGIALTAGETEEDTKRKEEELELLGPLCYQKDNKKFTELIQELENNVKAEALKLYTDKAAKFLTGTDKLPDYLRTYLEEMRKQTEQFKNSCCRSLRESNLKLSDMAEKINEMVFESTKRRYMIASQRAKIERNSVFDCLTKEMEDLKERHDRLLRPNLSNPSCKEEFDTLNQTEQERWSKYIEEIETYKRERDEETQTVSNRFFKAMINNFEFLIMYYDRTYLYEDFVRVPGDEEVQKKRANLKTLLKTKMTGITVDRSTERCIEKKWAGVPLDSFMLAKGTPLPYEEDELLLPVTEETQQKGGAAKGKGGKKEEKKGEKEKKPAAAAGVKVEAKEESEVAMTREVPSFKTFRQKTCYQARNRVFEEYKKYFGETVEEINKKFETLKERELKFQFQWERNIEEIFARDRA